MLTYKIPPEPSAKRVYVWRKLKWIGALLYQDSCWVLPANPRTREQLQWLVAEIIELGGQGTLWEASPNLGIGEESLIRKFIERVDESYQEIIAKLEQGDADLDALSRQYQQIRMKDYFKSETGNKVRDKLLAERRVEP